MLMLVNTAARFLPRREFHSSSRSRGARASLAAGCNRVGLGQIFQVLSGVLVTIMFCSTGITGPATFSQNEIFVNNATTRTGPARRVPTVRENNITARQSSFVNKLSADFAHGSIHDRFGESPVLRHPLYVQVLETDPTKLPDHVSGQLVDCVVTNTSHAGVELLDLRLRLLVVFTTSSTPRQFLIESAKPFFQLSKNTGSGDTAAVRDHGEVYDSEIYPTYCLGFAAMWIDPGVVNLDLNRNIPMSCSFREFSRQDLAGETELLPQSNPAKFGYSKTSSDKNKRTPFNGKRLFGPPLLLELWVSRLLPCFDPSEEVVERLAEIFESSVRYTPGKFPHPRRFGGIQHLVEDQPGRLFACFVKLLPGVESPIVSVARSSGTPAHPGCLDVVQVQAYPVREQGHGTEYNPFSSGYRCSTPTLVGKHKLNVLNYCAFRS